MLDEKIKATFRDAAQKLTGPKKQAFMAKGPRTTLVALLAKVRRCRHSVQLGLHERRTGITCVD